MYLIGNWKMKGERRFVSSHLQSLRALVEQAAPPQSSHGLTLIQCPPALWLIPASEALAGSSIALGAQDCHGEAYGAYTGDISAPMLVQAGCRYVILGHSERRRDHSESDARVAQKVQAALVAGLIPILCVGETQQQRYGLDYRDHIRHQLAASLPPLPAIPAEAFVMVAYEPVWAIGAGTMPNPTDIAEVLTLLHQQLQELGFARHALIYGGSVKAHNAGELMAVPGLDGLLLGEANLHLEEWEALLGTLA